ncbi:MAG: hypothetical protein A3G41_08255 [Elusimicrobia bacterium RIFCSPLOWO2_12_FULL_59_9]|nr:PilZ domain-containing protein [Elusimicrobiota bacterium]OGS04114.1 MAG: hypothetical protein A3G41_08255 [Elusimicrobia bacterium RIFCSPLOWO2_12_FULL_59_9]
MRRRRSVRLNQYLPVLWTLGEGAQNGWGRLLDLSAVGARLLTRGVLTGEEIFLSFELETEKFNKLRCRVARAEQDRDGYWVYGLEIAEDAARARLKQRLMSILSRAGQAGIDG